MLGKWVELSLSLSLKSRSLTIAFNGSSLRLGVRDPTKICAIKKKTRWSPKRLVWGYAKTKKLKSKYNT